jgi:hypothetical protein
MKTLTIKAKNSRQGMDMSEIIATLMSAKRSGCNQLGRTRVGFRGQIVEMNFREKK